MKTTTYTLPAHWACALINADESGMDDDEIAAMNDWLSASPRILPRLLRRPGVLPLARRRRLRPCRGLPNLYFYQL